MSMFILSLIYLLTFLGGWGIASGLGSRHPAERLGLGILIGSSLLTYMMFLLFNFAKISLGKENVAISLVILLMMGAVSIFVGKVPVKVGLHQLVDWLAMGWKLQKKQLIDFVFVCFLSGFFLFTVTQNLYWPVFDWDALALYDFHAKVFAQTGGMIDGIQRGYFLHYQPYTSLLHTINYLFGAEQA